MTRKLFGTDGVRGTANREPITAQTALRLAMAAGAQFTRGDHRHTVVIGKDTRLSGYMLEPALASGFLSMGMDVVLLGPLPTPGVGMLTRSLRADLGVMISASHNPFQDNGIKLFGPDGFKLSDAVELEIEERIDTHANGSLESALAAPHMLGRARRMDDGVGRYIEFVKASFPRRLTLEGLKIVVDCAHGAAYRVAPNVLYELGAEVIAIGDEPNGLNINDGCGAMAPEAMCRTVVEEGAALGIALDGDADRVIVADETGRIVDGDQLMAMIARDWLRSGQLRGGGLVTTVMSNLGLERYVEGLGIGLVRTPVGDRYVVERMRRDGYNVGGEQSGHIVLSDFTTTGDGVIAALQFLAAVAESGKPASEASYCFDPLPQRLRNVRFEAGSAPLEFDDVKRTIADVEARLNGRGRLVIRKSGTEPVIRVMAEAEDEALVGEALDTVAASIREATG
jgi:phosphoglucosamine mutase